MTRDVGLWMWIAQTIAIGVAITASLVWSWRTGQFRHREHARRLPLEARIPPPGEGRDV